MNVLPLLISMRNLRLIIALTTVGILIPTGMVFAKSSMTLQKLSTIIQSNTRPIGFTMKVEGAYDDYAVKMTVQGVQSATDGDKPMEGEMLLEGTMNLPKGASAHITLESRVVGTNAYMRIIDFTVKNGASLGIDAEDYEPYMNVWIRFPLSKEQIQQLSAKGRVQRSNSLRPYEQYFDITETESAGVRRYTVSIPPAKQRRLLMAISRKTRQYSSPRFNAEVQRNIRSTTIMIDAVVDVLTTNGYFDASTIKTSVATKIDGKKSSISVDLMSHTTTNPIIRVPDGSKLLDELVSSAAPVQQLSDARNAQRRADVNTILNATYQYAIDNNGLVPSSISTVEKEICTSRPGADCTGLVNLSILTGSYLVAIPRDPLAATENSTRYTIQKSINNRITVKAPAAEGVAISVTR